MNPWEIVILALVGVVYFAVGAAFIVVGIFTLLGQR